MRKLLIITTISMIIIAITAVIIGIITADNYQDIIVEIEPYEEDLGEAGGVVRLGTTADIVDTGLLEMLAQEFYDDTGIVLEYLYVETGEALAISLMGEADIVLDNIPHREDGLVQEGYPVEWIPVMYNDFIVVGPGDMIEDTQEVGLLLTLIEVLGLPFISRGDNSGVHQSESYIWESLFLDPTANTHYTRLGEGMSDTLRVAADNGAFTLVDWGTWLSQSHIVGDRLIILCQGDPILLNQYSVKVVNPQIHLEVNIQGANAFIEWLTSDRARGLIGQFGVAEFGEPLFMPGARVTN
jgi:tungstate transport system substrate-binding protein